MQTAPLAEKGVLEQVVEWIDERSGVVAVWRAVFLRKLPKGVGWWYTVGSATLFVFLLQTATGIFLAMYYSPSPDEAYNSIQYIMTSVAFGDIVRGLHHWGGSAMVVLVGLHMLRVFIMGAYKYPRELTWVVGVFLFVLTLGFGFTGYLLPWDEKAYWATTVGTNMAGTVPLGGGFILKLVRGGADVGAVTLTRFYSLHMLLLPALTIIFLGVHIYLVIRQGISAPPNLAEEREALRAGQAQGE